jgi:hypothetical protein
MRNGGLQNVTAMAITLGELALEDIQRIRHYCLFTLQRSKLKVLIAYDEAHTLHNYARDIVVWRNHTFVSEITSNGTLRNGTSALCIPVRNAVNGIILLFAGTEFRMQTLISAASYFLKGKPKVTLDPLAAWEPNDIREFFSFYLRQDLVSCCEEYFPKLCGRARFARTFLDELLQLLPKCPPNRFREIAAK